MEVRFTIKVTHMNLMSGNLDDFVSGLFKRVCKENIEVSNIIILHNQNPNLSARNLKDLSQKNLGEKCYIAPDMGKVTEKIRLEFADAEDKIWKKKKIDLTGEI